MILKNILSLILSSYTLMSHLHIPGVLEPAFGRLYNETGPIKKLNIYACVCVCLHIK